MQSVRVECRQRRRRLSASVRSASCVLCCKQRVRQLALCSARRAATRTSFAAIATRLALSIQHYQMHVTLDNHCSPVEYTVTGAVHCGTFIQYCTVNVKLTDWHCIAVSLVCSLAALVSLSFVLELELCDWNICPPARPASLCLRSLPLLRESCLSSSLSCSLLY